MNISLNKQQHPPEPSRQAPLVPAAATIAGSDSGGGAGIQADLKTFQELGVFGASALTAVTAQNTLGVHGVHPIPPSMVTAQIDAVAEDIGPAAWKTGMLFSAEIIEAVADRASFYKWSRLVVDPVMIAKGGASLLQENAVQALRSLLLPLAQVVTPNIPEAEALTGMRIEAMADRKEAARRIHAWGVKYVVLKGGHGGNRAQSLDLLYDGRVFTEFAAPWIETRHTHGTGCTFAAALTAGLASGLPMDEGVLLAKRFIQAALTNPLNLGAGHGPTNHWGYNRQGTAGVFFQTAPAAAGEGEGWLR
ncbi:bifunctional hydroxymethylpyrimidine kinase/phosphomethylpyrimidine kinase [Paenibacillus chitinolyticus]|uniref:Hydroxymethylpyrimidine/phosphomethylpyrimidine kinase n=1 Tax=Paenibacillus chitinolyticus TaxID=79263 RepID=A0A410X430_9BACL|nr:bifunctional hydroxymethylpyrimidine kinase/phosphomethylpyrimidine kinase [Paenibacillus chitinolyticus]MCY9592206.1 bifunctional hydroxymethylpyrimidine kinase/phosphomethylpyrimidine kinase [Paenibacillus chitinolyticus]MCY9598441.1 bifunctional hydroxymethylpyrimidine kinase/phosphomethylpyrimidine kinase [Paenibacillus chitinolyticus]QAV21374.1 bifunctional hydroxymethylpyrimidine kinase/phosphomethylpyrimidine kinase [Paenibacillus chitinolyticus]